MNNISNTIHTSVTYELCFKHYSYICDVWIVFQTLFIHLWRMNSISDIIHTSVTYE